MQLNMLNDLAETMKALDGKKLYCDDDGDDAGQDHWEDSESLGRHCLTIFHP